MGGGQLVKGFVGDDQAFVVDPIGDRQPVELFWTGVVPGFGVSKKSGGYVLDQLVFVDGARTDAIEE